MISLSNQLFFSYLILYSRALLRVICTHVNTLLNLFAINCIAVSDPDTHENLFLIISGSGFCRKKVVSKAVFCVFWVAFNGRGRKKIIYPSPSKVFYP